MGDMAGKRHQERLVALHLACICVSVRNDSKQ